MDVAIRHLYIKNIHLYNTNNRHHFLLDFYKSRLFKSRLSCTDIQRCTVKLAQKLLWKSKI